MPCRFALHVISKSLYRHDKELADLNPYFTVEKRPFLYPEEISMYKNTLKERLLAYPFPRLVIQWPSDVYGSRHVFHSKGSSCITLCDFVTNSGSCNKKEIKRVCTL